MHNLYLAICGTDVLLCQQLRSWGVPAPRSPLDPLPFWASFVLLHSRGSLFRQDPTLNSKSWAVPALRNGVVPKDLAPDGAAGRLVLRDSLGREV